MAETTTTRTFLMTTSFSAYENYSVDYQQLSTENSANEIQYKEQSLINSTDLSFYPVNSSTITDFTASIVLLIGLIGNVLGICIFSFRQSGKKPMVLDKIIAFLCFTGLITTIVSTPLHLYASRTNYFPSDTSICQMQGLLLNLLCLISLWYTALLASERFFRLVFPYEHRLTFSPMNLNVILAGVFVLLVVEVCGPIYGWAEYTFLNDSTVCLLNPNSNHILTYSIIHVTCYVVLPIVVTFCFTCHIIRQSVMGNEKLLNGSQVLKTDKGILVLCVGMLLTMLLLVPYHVALILQALIIPLTMQQKVLGYWLHIIGITCVYPIVLSTLARKEWLMPLFQPEKPNSIVEVLPILQEYLSARKKYFMCHFCVRRQSRESSANCEAMLVTLGSPIERPRRDCHERGARAKTGSASSITSTTNTVEVSNIIRSEEIVSS